MTAFRLSDAQSLTGPVRRAIESLRSYVDSAVAAISARLAVFENGPAWIPMTGFTNGWANFGAPYLPVAYRKKGDEVQVRGLMASGTIGAAAWSLPVGYRPLGDMLWATDSSNAHARMTLSSGGVFTPGNGTNTHFAVNFSFSTL